MFSSDELDYLATLLDVKLPTVKSMSFFSLDGSSLKEVEKARKRLVQYKEKLQAWAGHDWSLLGSDIDIKTVQDRVKNTITQNITPCEKLLNAFIQELAAEKKPSQTILSDLSSHETLIKKAITDIQKFVNKEAKNRKERNGLIDNAKKAANDLMSTYIKASGALTRVDEICSQTDVPEPRQKLLETIKSVHQKSKEQITKLYGSDEFKNLSPLNPIGLSNTDIQKLEGKAIALKNSFEQELSTLNDAIKQWDTQLKALLPTIEIFGNVKSTYKKYTALCTEIETTNLFPDEHKKISRKLLDAQYLKPFLESSSNPQKSQEAVSNFAEFHKIWKEQLGKAQKERDDAQNNNVQVNKQYDESASFLDSITLQKSKEYIVEINRLFSNCDFKEHNAKCAEFKALMESQKKRIDEGKKLHKDWPLSKLNSLTKEIEEQKAQIESMGLEAPLRIKEHRNFIRNIQEMYKLDSSTKFHPSDYMQMINKLVEKKDELAKFIKDMSNKKINKLHKEQAKTEKKRLNIIGEAGKTEENIRNKQTESAELQSKVQDTTDKMNIIEAKKKEAEKKQKDAKKASKSDKEDYYRDIAKNLQSKFAKLTRLKNKNKQQQQKNSKELEGLREKLKKLQGDPNDPNFESELSRVESELSGIQESIEEETSTLVQDAFPKKQLAKWNSRINTFEKELEKHKKTLKKNDALDLESIMLSPFTNDRNNIEKEWKHTQSDFFVMIKQDPETVPSPTIGEASLEKLDALIIRIKAFEINTETITKGKEDKKNQDFLSQKQRFLVKIRDLKKGVEDSAIPLSLRKLETKVDALKTEPEDWEEREEDFDKSKEELEQNLKKQKKEDSKAFDDLCQKRRELEVTVEARKEIALSQWKWFHNDLEHIRTAYAQLEKEIAVYDDSYLRSASTEPELTSGVHEAFDKLAKKVESFDDKGLGDLAKQYKDLSSSITNSISLLSAAKTLQKCLPKAYESLDTEIKAIKAEQTTTSLDKLQKRFQLWSSFFTTEEREANRVSEKIKTLLASSAKLNDEISKHGGYEAHADLRASLLKGLSEITESKVQTSAQFNSASEVFEGIMQKHTKCLKSAKDMDAEGTLFLEQEASKERRKKDWEAFIKEYENKVMDDLKKIIAKQKENPKLDKGEIKRLDDSLSNAKEALKAAQKAGEQGAYREGRMHLKKISATMATLKKYPNGVNAHRIKNLSKTQDMWIDSLKNIKSQVDAFKKTLSARMSKEGIDAKHISTVEASIDTFVNGLYRNTFIPAIQMLDGGKNLESGREMGLSTVRDIRNDLQGSSGSLFLGKGNPFQKTDLSTVYKTLDSIEKTFLLYR